MILYDSTEFLYLSSKLKFLNNFKFLCYKNKFINCQKLSFNSLYCLRILFNS